MMKKNLPADLISKTLTSFTRLLLILLIAASAAFGQDPTKPNKKQTISLAAGSNPVVGSGTPGQITRWTGVSGSNTNVVGDSNIFEDKFGKVGIGTRTPTSLLTVQGMIETTLGGYKFPDGTLQTTAFDPNQVVRSLNGLTGNIILAAGANITITPGGNTLTIAAANALTGVAHDATLQGNGTFASPLGVAVPLTLNGSLPGPVFSAANSGAGVGVNGFSFNNVGVNGSSTNGNGVSGQSTDGFGVSGTSNRSNGVIGQSVGSGAMLDPNRAGVVGLGLGTGIGVRGGSESSVGVDGIGITGVRGTGNFSTSAFGGIGVSAQGGDSGSNDGGDGVSAVGGKGLGAGKVGGNGIRAIRGFGFAGATDGRAGLFFGDVEILGNLTKTMGTFKIDHPLDPENQYLYHSFVESPDMMNIYNGNITTDANGEAAVDMPDYFDALNKDFRYQLTVIGQFAQAIVASKMKGNRFMIKTNAPNVEVSWMVTGVRQDAYADKNRVQVEVKKSESERGFYLHPEVFNQPEEKSIEWARHPELMQKLKQQRVEAEKARGKQKEQQR